ncbi:hypothetical protein [uncultured Microbulbifer sp.]|uniref:hypothetical protein n=1 Tax=uncultured Microbulbifer sp. TaxID=348147 RepID=UPI0026248279|nr:hypothetical protein [uncultured Microbulbifer sp.]
MFNVKNTLRENRSSHKGVNFVYLPKENSKKLLIILSPHNQGDRFCWVKILVPSHDMSLLYINNPADDFYSLETNHAVYKEIIKSVSSIHEKKHTHIMGSSMSAFAALRIGMDLDVSVFAIGPQVVASESKEFAAKSFPKNPKLKLIDDIAQLQERGVWQNLTDFINDFNKKLPPIYLMINHLRFDTENGYAFVDAIKRKAGSKLVCIHSKYVYHGFKIKSKEDVLTLYQILDILTSLSEISFSWE